MLVLRRPVMSDTTPGMNAAVLVPVALATSGLPVAYFVLPVDQTLTKLAQTPHWVFLFFFVAELGIGLALAAAARSGTTLSIGLGLLVGWALTLTAGVAVGVAFVAIALANSAGLY
jgi:hypothetical protein